MKNNVLRILILVVGYTFFSSNSFAVAQLYYRPSFGPMIWDSPIFPNWSTMPNGSGPTVFWTNGSPAVFATEFSPTPLTISIQGTVATPSISFNQARRFQFTGGAIDISGGSTFNTSILGNNDDFFTLFWTSTIIGNGDLTIAAHGNQAAYTGSGLPPPGTISALSLHNPSNSFVGNVTLTSGQVDTSSRFGAASNLVILNGGGIFDSLNYNFTRNISVGAAGGTYRTWTGYSSLQPPNTKAEISGNISGSGTLRRVGAGQLKISGDGSNFTGTLLNLEGHLTFDSPAWNGNVTMETFGGALGGKGNIGGTLTLAKGTNARLAVNPSTPSALSANTLTVTGTGSVVVDFDSMSMATGPATILNYNNTNAVAADFSLFGGNSNYRGHSFNVGSNKVELTLERRSLTWTGVNSTSWHVAGTQNNWTDSSVQNFYWADDVRFDDTSASNPSVTVSGIIRPASIVVDSNSNNFTFSSSSTDSSRRIDGPTSLTKLGTSVLQLNGNNTYTGPTTIEEGALMVNGNHLTGPSSRREHSSSVGAYTVGAAGTLMGSGFIDAPVTVNGTLSPGNSIESLSIDDLIMNDGSRFVWEALNSSATGADFLLVNGDLSLNGVNLDLSMADLAADSWTVGDKLTLISYRRQFSGSGFVGFADDSVHKFGNNFWLINYNDTVRGTNFSSQALARNVTFTFVAVPEPASTFLFFAISLAAYLRRHRQRDC